ncbi:MAG: class I SAM-dependent methyltransferase [Pseudomonadota bacterium]
MLDPRVKALYANSPRLERDYIQQVLGLRGEQAAKVGEINGGIHLDEAEMLCSVVNQINPAESLEIGLGYGFSAMTICTSGQRPSEQRRHVVIDPHQTQYWNGTGLRHLNDAGLSAMIEFKEDVSYRVLPDLEHQKQRFDLAFIDGWHTFDFVFVDFFYIDKLLKIGGVVVFDDADWDSIRPVLRYVVTNLDYEVYASTPERKPESRSDSDLGLVGSCIALQKTGDSRGREIFYHRSFTG